MSKEPLGPVAPLGDDQWFNIVKWVVYATIEAEEQGITSENVADTAETSDNPVVQRLLGVTPEGAEPFDRASGSRTGPQRDLGRGTREIYERNWVPERRSSRARPELALVRRRPPLRAAVPLSRN